MRDHHVVLGDVLAETLLLSPRGRRAALAEVAVPLDLVAFLVVLLMDRAHLALFVLIIGRDADVSGDLHSEFGHPNDTGYLYIKSEGVFLRPQKHLFSAMLLTNTLLLIPESNVHTSIYSTITMYCIATKGYTI